MSYWKSKVLPKFKKFFDKGTKRKGAAEVCKTFDKSKESLDKEFEEKGSDLNPKVVEIYRSSTTFISKKLLKEPKEETVKANPDAVQSVLEELVKAGFPGAQVISDAGTKFGPALLPGPVVYLFEKASVYLVEEELLEEPKPAETREVKLEDVKPAEEAGEAEVPPPVAAVVEEVAAVAPATEGTATAVKCEPAVTEERKEETEAEEEEDVAAGVAPPAAVTEPPPAVETPATVETPPVLPASSSAAE